MAAEADEQMTADRSKNGRDLDLAGLGQFAEAVIADVLDFFDVKGGGLLSHFLSDFLRRKAEEAREILLQELRLGKVDELHAASKDEAFAIFFRYGRAIRDGTARRNLRLLARTMVGLAKRDRLFADEFNKYAEMLERLSRDEILVIGRLHSHRKKHKPGQGTAQYWPKFCDELVPSQFPNQEYLVAICCSAMRSGLVITPPDFASSGYYATSPIMDEIAELADFQEVLHAEGELAGHKK